MIDLAGARIVTDPVLCERVWHLRRIAPPPPANAFAGAAAVLVSHAHFDHLHVPSIREVAPRGPVIVPRGYGSLLRRRGVAGVVEVVAGERLPVGAGTVLAVPAEHDGRRHPLDRCGAALGYVVEAGATRVYFAGDTDLYSGMAGAVGPLDVALLPVWGWGRRVGPGHLDPERAARAASLLRPRIAVPIHWGTFASPRVAWRADPGAPARAFAQHAGRLAPEVEVRVLAPGGRLAL